MIFELLPYLSLAFAVFVLIRQELLFRKDRRRWRDARCRERLRNAR
jgi:hypothetical protein